MKRMRETICPPETKREKKETREKKKRIIYDTDGFPWGTTSFPALANTQRNRGWP